jgi:hypothetical protein
MALAQLVHSWTLVFLCFFIFSTCDSYLKYTEHSCTDLTPKAFNDITNSEQLSPSKIVHSKWRRRRKRSSTASATPLLVGHTHENYDTSDGLPFKVRVFVKRYRRDDDVTGKWMQNTDQQHLDANECIDLLLQFTLKESHASMD